MSKKAFSQAAHGWECMSCEELCVACDLAFVGEAMDANHATLSLAAPAVHVHILKMIAVYNSLSYWTTSSKASKAHDMLNASAMKPFCLTCTHSGEQAMHADQYA